MSNVVLVRGCAGILALVGAWAAYTQNPPQAAKPAPPQNLIRVAGDLYMIDGGSNAVFYITDEGVIVIDNKFDRDFDGIMAKIRAVTPQPVKYVINTHHHGDHTGGNQKFSPTAEILAHVNSRIHHVELQQPAPPRIAFTHEASVFLGGKEVRAVYCGRGHTDGDVFIYFPALRILHTGDMMAGNSPLVDYATGGSLLDWAQTLDCALKLDSDTVIQGHGPVVKRAELIQYRDAVETFRTRVTSLVREGKPKEEVAQFLVSAYGWVPNGLPMQRSLDGLMTELR